MLRFPSQRHPPTAFRRPSRVSLIQCYSLISCRNRSSGSDSSRLFPFRELYPARHQAIPSRRFSVNLYRRSKTTASATGRTPRVFCPHKVRYPSQEYCIPRWFVALMSFATLTAFDTSDWNHVPMTHPPMVSTCRAFKLTQHADLRRFPSKASGISHSHERLPSQRFWPFVPPTEVVGSGWPRSAPLFSSSAFVLSSLQTLCQHVTSCNH